MAIHQNIAMLLLFALALAKVQLSTGQVVKGFLSCLDCDKDFDFSGIKVMVKCNQVKKLAVTTAEKDGFFKTHFPTDTDSSSSTSTSNHCLAKILGGPEQLYTYNKNMVTNVVKAHDSLSTSYTISHPLAFYTSCPFSHNHGHCEPTDTSFGSSKTIDLPIPTEWGLPPTSYYAPLFPIIGIP